MFAADNSSSTVVQLTDEDEVLLARCQQMQQQSQRGVSNKPLVSHTAASECSEVVTTSAVTTVDSADVKNVSRFACFKLFSNV